MSPKILLVLHDDSMSGAPIAALNFVKVLRHNLQMDTTVLIVNFKDDLAPKFKALGVTVLTERHLKVTIPNYLRFNNVRNAIHKIKGNHVVKSAQRINNSFDAIIYNSVVAIDQCRHLISKLVIPQYAFVHELHNSILAFFSDAYVYLKKMNAIFAPSNAVIANLRSHGLSPQKLHYIPLTIEQHENEPATKSNGFIVGNLANPGWPKGLDYFLAISKRYVECYPNDKIQFIWKGFSENSFNYELALYEIQQSGLANQIALEMKESSNEDFFRKLSVLLLPSKEEAFGLVMLEAARYKVPSIGFKNTGGVQEFIEGYGGLTAPYLSIEHMVKHIKFYHNNRVELEAHGYAAHQYYINNHTINKHVLKGISRALHSSGLI